MKSISMLAWTLALALLPGAGRAAAGDAATTPDADTARAQAAMAELGQSLRTALQAKVAQDGAVAAVAFCHDRAPLIAAEIASKHGVRVGRTSLKQRSPAKKNSVKEEHLAQTVAQLTTSDEPEKKVFNHHAPATLNDLEPNHFEQAFGLGDADIKNEDEGVYGVSDPNGLFHRWHAGPTRRMVGPDALVEFRRAVGAPHRATPGRARGEADDGCQHAATRQAWLGHVAHHTAILGAMSSICSSDLAAQRMMPRGCSSPVLRSCLSSQRR